MTTEEIINTIDVLRNTVKTLWELGDTEGCKPVGCLLSKALKELDKRLHAEKGTNEDYKS